MSAKSQILKNVVLRPSVPDEEAMIQAFRSNQRYAAKSKLGREWLFRGLVLLKQRIAGVSGSGGRNEIIMAAIGDGMFDYQTVAAYLDALDALGNRAVSASGQEHGRVSVMPMSDGPQVVAAVESLDAPEKSSTQALAGGTENVIEEEPVVQGRWAHLKNLAGSGD